MSGIIGAPNVYAPIEWVSTTVAHQSELQNAMKEMTEAGYFPMQMAFGRLEPLRVDPTWFVIGWRIVPTVDHVVDK